MQRVEVIRQGTITYAYAYTGVEAEAKAPETAITPDEVSVAATLNIEFEVY